MPHARPNQSTTSARAAAAAPRATRTPARRRRVRRVGRWLGRIAVALVIVALVGCVLSARLRAWGLELTLARGALLVEVDRRGFRLEGRSPVAVDLRRAADRVPGALFRPDGQRYPWGGYIRWPLGSLALLAGAGWLLVAAGYRGTAVPPGHCTECGFDLRGTAGAGPQPRRCPECGALQGVDDAATADDA